ncbi:MAG: nucleotidyltransferase domain-containing protein [Tannerella sp.]|jgi:predicted nucleotidyltransferase|nr:nucleotidyltransferase domain-containing protein [Tannerella sp.]
MDKKAVIIEKAKEYKELVNSMLPFAIEQYWLYGSYAKGMSHKHSDIDIAMIVSHIDDEIYWKNLSLLWKLTYQVDDRIEPVLIARDTDYAGFLDEIQNTGVEI